MKNTLLSMAFLGLAAAFGFSSCAQCYNERFCQQMIGASDEQVFGLMGQPSSLQTVGNTTTMTWFTDQSYISTHTRPARERHWRDEEGHHHSVYHPAEVVQQYNSQKAEITFISQGGRIVNYRTVADYDMCNALVPQHLIQQYIAEDEAAKAAARAAQSAQ